MVHAFAAYVGAALAEIAGCFASWAWLRLDRTALWVLPGMLSLALFAFLVPTSARRSPGPPRPMGMS